MVMVLWVIAALLLLSVFFLQKFMRDMAKVEDDLIGELRQMKQYLKEMSEK